MSTKVCFKCGAEKELNQFYKHKQMKDGHVNKCISCNKDDVKNRYKAKSKDSDWIEKERARGRNKYHRLYSGLKSKRGNRSEHNKKHRSKYPEKYKATAASKRVPTINPESHRHHWSYNEEHYKDIIELSIKDHNKAHRFLKYDSELYMYRTVDGRLLNTKEEHEEYIMDVIENMPD